VTTPDALTLDIEGLAYGGDAFGRAEDGRMVFVPFAAPGERVRCTLVEDHARWAKGELVDIITPHPERIEPACPHFGNCGGCHYQFLPYTLQVEAKQDIVRSQLLRIGKIQDPPLQAMIPSPRTWNMRNHIQFHQRPDGTLGFHRAGSSEIMPINTCLLPLEPIRELWTRVELDPMEGVERIGFRCDSMANNLVILHGNRSADVEMSMDADASVAWISPYGTQILGGEAHLQYHVLDQPFLVSPSSFFQVNSSLLERMVNEVMGFLKPQAGETVLDLYAGVGLFSVFAASNGAAVIAVESGLSSCNDFALNLEPFDDIELYQAQVEEVVPYLDRSFDAVIVDPPRAGLAREVRDALIENRPKRLVYVSCDTATFARDARRLIDGGFTCTSIQPIDLFPQTYHIELISYWE